MAVELEDTLSTGRLGRLIGKFRLERQLGKGAMGEVYLGVHLELGNAVAVKFLTRDGTDSTSAERFFNEARAVAAIDHENVGKVIDHDRLPDGTPYIVMEYVEGRTLRELLQDTPLLGLRRAVELMLDTLSALQAAHAKGIVHRDLKPENLRVTPGGRVKVLDFGIAKQLDRPSTALTAKGAIIGTPHYMSPEQVMGLAVDGRSDLYAVAVMLFECTTGHRPFEAETLVDLLKRQVDAAPPWPRRLRADLPASLEQVILKGLEKTPERRFEGARQMREALAATVHELPPLTASVPQPLEPSRVEQATPNLGYLPTTPQAVAPKPVVVASPRPEDATAPMPAVQPRWPWLALLVVAGVVGGIEGMRLWSDRQVAAPVAQVIPAPTPAPPPTPTPTPAPPPTALEPAPAPPVEVKAPVKTAQPLPPPPRTKGAPKPVEPKPAPLLVASAPVPSPQPKASGVKLIETGGDRVTRPIDFDPTHFDALGYLAAAKALARTRMDDAELIDFSVDGVFADGHVDLTLAPQFDAEYHFRSPSHSQSNPVLPDDAQDLPCLVYVEVSARKVELFDALSFHGCHERILPRISCPLPQAAQAAIAQGGLADKVAKASWLHDGWFFSYGDSGPSLSVRCSSPGK